jgi:uncharacterized radical SAM superfamily protein
MINTKIFKDDLKELYNRYNECIKVIKVQNKIFLKYVCEDGFLAEAEDSIMAEGNAKIIVVQIEQDYNSFVAIMGDYKSVDELGEALFKVENNIINIKYGTNDEVLAEMSKKSEDLKNRLDKAQDIIDKYCY